MNIAALVQAQARRAPAATALAWDGGGISYGALCERAHAMAQQLRARGLRPGDRVALLAGNDPAAAVALLGALWAGLVTAVLSAVWSPADAARALALADARLLLTTEALAAAVGAPREATMLLDDVVARSPGMPGARWMPPHPARASDPATILFSSGTTGDPKGVVLTHGNLAFNARAKVAQCGIAPADRLALVVPLSHCFGQNVILLGALVGGASVHLFQRFDAARVAHAVRDGQVSMLLASPTVFSRLLDLGAPRGLRYALSAAAPLPDGLRAAWRETAGIPLAQGYGLTECSPFATYDAGAADDGGVGRPIPGVEVRVASLDDDGWLGPEACGEVAIRGPNVMPGYWRRPADTARALRDGWLRTGDVGRLDADGRLHLVDRLDDVINVAGFKAWPSDVERAVNRHDAVLESAAYGVPDAHRGAAVAVAVVLRAGAIARPEDILASAAPHLAGFQRPVRLELVHALPRSPAGKVLRRVLANAGATAV